MNDKKEQLLEKELILDEITSLSDKLRTQVGQMGELVLGSIGQAEAARKLKCGGVKRRVQVLCVVILLLFRFDKQECLVVGQWLACTKATLHCRNKYRSG